MVCYREKSLVQASNPTSVVVVVAVEILNLKKKKSFLLTAISFMFICFSFFSFHCLVFAYNCTLIVGKKNYTILKSA